VRARAALVALLAAGLLTGCSQVACTPGQVCVVTDVPATAPAQKPAKKVQSEPTPLPPPPAAAKPSEKERRTVGFHVRRLDTSILIAYLDLPPGRGRPIERIDEKAWQHLEYKVVVGQRVSMEVVGLPHVEGDCWITINGREASSVKRPEKVPPFTPRSGFAEGTCMADAVVY
jgi:hypothetical protein